MRAFHTATIRVKVTLITRIKKYYYLIGGFGIMFRNAWKLAL